MEYLYVLWIVGTLVTGVYLTVQSARNNSDMSSVVIAQTSVVWPILLAWYLVDKIRGKTP